MKPVRYWSLVAAAVFVSACGKTSDSPAAKCASDSTFEQVQEQIFEGRGCTLSNCHGDSPQGGLDLRADVAYENLINVDSVYPVS